MGKISKKRIELLSKKVLILSAGAGRSRRPGPAGTQKVTFLIYNPLKKYRFYAPGPVGAGGRERPGLKKYHCY